MKHRLEKYVGQVVTVIYAGRDKGLTKRRVKLLEIGETYARTFCLERLAPRTLSIESVLAVGPGVGGKRYRRSS
ncbi:hypothetical protein [Paenibacillus sp.]|uniref:hypothetical protein n=1 Tax=Paenibacillus sp. TaxID=58172 RepID=UPI002D3108E3|nr:hypothetical protein [Paenibacillus sp.]HZG83802.1 hypothetical protein [Paenibacillus sp.]